MSRSDRILAAAGGAALILAMAAGWILLAPVAGTPKPSDDAAALLLGTPTAASSTPTSSPEPATIVVDVEGAVVQPGIRELPSGSRIADAIAAAGGYGPDVDLDAAAEAINLAERLSDGAQIRVPRIGEGAVAATGAPGDGGGTDTGGAAAGGTTTPEGGGAVNLNTATATELEALPGIGPVTVEKIIAARQERPFTSLDDAVQRGAINRGQLNDIQGLATAG